MDRLILIKLIFAVPWLVYLGISDFRRRVLPNWATLGGAAVMLALLFGFDMNYALGSILSALLSSLFLLLPYFLRAAGAGDVKMLFTAGLVAGPGNVLNLILFVSLSGLVLAAVMLILRKVDPARLRHCLRCVFDFRYDRAAGKAGLPPADSEACRVPFGAAIAAGLFLNLVFQTLAVFGGRGTA